MQLNRNISIIADSANAELGQAIKTTIQGLDKADSDKCIFLYGANPDLSLPEGLANKNKSLRPDKEYKAVTDLRSRIKSRQAVVLLLENPSAWRNAIQERVAQQCRIYHQIPEKAITSTLTTLDINAAEYKELLFSTHGIITSSRGASKLAEKLKLDKTRQFAPSQDRSITVYAGRDIVVSNNTNQVNARFGIEDIEAQPQVFGAYLGGFIYARVARLDIGIASKVGEFAAAPLLQGKPEPIYSTRKLYEYFRIN